MKPENLIYGKVPPQAVDLECAVLGALMIDADALMSVIDQIEPEMFYDNQNALVAQGIMSLYRANKPVDILTVTQELRRLELLDEAGGPYYLSTLTSRVANAAHIDEHVKIVIEKYIGRQIIAIGSKATSAAYEDSTDVFDLLQTVEKNFYDISNKKAKEPKKANALVKKAIQKAQDMKQNEGSSWGVPSGISELDRVTNGWQNSDLIIVAARPSMGKSAFVTSVSSNAAIDFKKPVAIFSLEMSEMQVMQRILSLRSGVDHENIKRGTLSEYELRKLHEAGVEMEDAPIWIDDTPALNVFELRSKLRRLKIRHGIELAIIDYLQLMVGPYKKGQNREGEVSEISRTLKAIAKELDIPIIALSQLSRKVEERGGTKKPMLSDLRESGAIEQDADIVCFLHRPEYYGIELDSEGHSTRGLAEVIFAKNRSGSLATVKTRFISSLTKFTDFDTFDDYVPESKNPYAETKAQRDDLPF